MNTSELREKLIYQFEDLISDSSKLTVLEGIFDSITPDKNHSEVPDDHYEAVQERRERYLSGKSSGASWEEVKQRLIREHGL